MTRREVLAAGVGLAAAGMGLAGCEQQAEQNLVESTPAPATSLPEEIIDIHPHIISSDLERYPPSPVGGVASDWSQEHPMSIEEYLAECDAAGVSKSAIVQASTWYGFNNSYLADSVMRYPARFIGVGSIDTVAPDAVAVLQAWRQRGIGGLRVRTGGIGPDILVDPRALPVWEYAQAEGMTVTVSTNAAGLPHLPTLLERFPGVKIVLEHGSMIPVEDGPPYRDAESFFEFARYDNFYMKVTPRTVALSRRGNSTAEAFFPRLVAVFGAHRLAFGSNLPSDEGPLTRIYDEARVAFSSLSAEDRAMIFSGTAKQLYPELA